MKFIKKFLAKRAFIPYFRKQTLRLLFKGDVESNFHDINREPYRTNTYYLLIMIRQKDIFIYKENLKAISALAFNNNFFIDNIFGPFILIKLEENLINSQHYNKPENTKNLVNILQNQLKEDIKIIYGYCNNAITGNMLNDCYYSYQTILPGFENIIQELLNLEYGKVKYKDIIIANK